MLTDGHTNGQTDGRTDEMGDSNSPQPNLCFFLYLFGYLVHTEVDRVHVNKFALYNNLLLYSLTRKQNSKDESNQLMYIYMIYIFKFPYNEAFVLIIFGAFYRHFHKNDKNYATPISFLHEYCMLSFNIFKACQRM